MGKPLEDIKILDLTRVLAGPFCTMVLADLGAEITKVEYPGRGDDSRGYGPFKNDRSLYFININRGKKSITLNLKDERGIAILKKLIKKFDVILENFVPGTMEELGIGYETLKDIHPPLIFASISGFGQTGPDSKKPAYDILAQAMGGIMAVTGWPGMPPTRIGISIGDITASLFTAAGITAALFQREKTGIGQRIDVAMLDCQVSILENALARYQVSGENPGPLGNRHPTITPFQAFKTLDGYLAVAAGNDDIWKRLCSAIGREDLSSDQRFNSNEKRTENISEILPLLEKIFLRKTSSQWIEVMEENRVPCGPISTMDMVMKNRQILSRNMLVEVTDTEAGTVLVAGNPIKMSSIPEEKSRPPAPAVGEDNLTVYGDLLGLTEAEINGLSGDGVI